MRRKRLIVVATLVVTAVVVGALAGLGVVTATASSDSPGLAAAEGLQRNGLGTRVATFPGASGTAERAVYLAQLPDGRTCLMDGDLDGRTAGGGCSRSAADPLGGRPFSVSFMFDGGPDASSVTDARLAGLVASNVAKLAAVMSDGSTRPLALSERGVASTSYRVFAFRVSQADLRKGVTPTVVVAYDRLGAELGRQSTGLPN
jgi:hypothetical protein